MGGQECFVVADFGASGAHSCRQKDETSHGRGHRLGCPLGQHTTLETELLSPRCTDQFQPKEAMFPQLGKCLQPMTMTYPG